jgi:hypothetical protein
LLPNHNELLGFSHAKRFYPCQLSVLDPIVVTVGKCRKKRTGFLRDFVSAAEQAIIVVMGNLGACH